MMKEESLSMAKLKVGAAAAVAVELLLLPESAVAGAAFLGTSTRPNREQARHRPAITLPQGCISTFKMH